MTAIFRDARFGLRLLRRNPGFTLVAVTTLALGIAATTAIFSVVYGLFFAPLPYYEADRLVMVWEYEQGTVLGASARSYTAWKRQATPFADINAWGGRNVNLATADRPENVSAGFATPGFLAMLGYGHPLALGRTFREDEGVAGRDNVVILTYQLWKDRFAGDPGIVGRQVRVDDEPRTVVGVLGEGPADHQQNKIWMPLVFTEAQLQSDNTSLLVMARLKDDATVDQASASMAALGASLEQHRAEQQPDAALRAVAHEIVAESLDAPSSLPGAEDAADRTGARRCGLRCRDDQPVHFRRRRSDAAAGGVHRLRRSGAPRGVGGSDGGLAAMVTEVTETPVFKKRSNGANEENGEDTFKGLLLATLAIIRQIQLR